MREALSIMCIYHAYIRKCYGLSVITSTMREGLYTCVCMCTHHEYVCKCSGLSVSTSTITTFTISLSFTTAYYFQYDSFSYSLCLLDFWSPVPLQTRPLPLTDPLLFSYFWGRHARPPTRVTQLLLPIFILSDTHLRQCRLPFS